MGLKIKVNDIILELGRGWVIILYIGERVTSGCGDVGGFFLPGDHHPFVGFMADAEGGPSASKIVLAVEVGAGCRVFLHIFLHPVRELFLPAEAKTCAFGGIFPEAAVEAVGRLS